MGKKQIRAANRTAKPHEIRLPRTRISNHKPRKGTETNPSSKAAFASCERFQTTNPARGRKQADREHEEADHRRISNHKPRKGTETCSSSVNPLFFRPISNHKPRKGTETFRQVPRSAGCSRKFQTTNPARGRKRSAGIAHSRRQALISNHKPRKGTETTDGCKGDGE